MYNKHILGFIFLMLGLISLTIGLTVNKLFTFIAPVLLFIALISFASVAISGKKNKQ